MAFIGNTNTTQAFTPAIDYFSGNGSTTAFTLSRPVASVAQVQVVVNNVAQNPSSAFTVSGNIITFTSAPSSGTNNIYVYYTSPITQVIAPSQGTVGTTQLQNGLTVNFADGTAAAPSITNDGDTNTGVFYPAADTVGVSTGGSERMRVDSSGNVGIGTSSPNKKLEVLSAGEIIRATSTTGANDQLISVKNDSGTANCSTNIFFADRYAASSYASSYIRGTTSGISALIFATGGTNFTNIYDAGAPIEQARITAAGLFQFNSGYGSVATAYGCRAWVNFNGTGTVAIRGSGNVSSITDNGAGNYTVNYTTAMPDANYVYHIGSKQESAGLGDSGYVTNGSAGGATDGAAGMTTTRIRLQFTNFDNPPAARDQEVVCVSIFR